MTCRILVLDDSTPIQKVIKIAFSKFAVDISAAGTLNEGFKDCEKSRPDLIIADASVPGVSTASDFSKLLAKSQGAAMVLLMGSYDSVKESDLRAAGFEMIVRKPFDAIELLDACEKMVPGKLQLVSQSGSSGSSSKLNPSKTPPPPVTNKAPMSQPESPTIQLSFDAKAKPPVSAPREDSQIPSFLLDSNDVDISIPQIPKLETSQKGRPAFQSTSDSFVDVVEHKPAAATVSSSDVLRAAENLIQKELPALIEKAVEKYCKEHFKLVAKEVLTAELRRLADEKAKFLVDQ